MTQPIRIQRKRIKELEKRVEELESEQSYYESRAASLFYHGANPDKIIRAERAADRAGNECNKVRLQLELANR